MPRFDQQVDSFVRKVEARFRAVARTAVQDTVSIAQRTIGEGGRMRVKTGFLRASIQAALNGMPAGQSDNLKGKVYPVGSFAGTPVSVTLLKWDPNTGEPLFVGWTANYARYREAHDGFLLDALEHWNQTVAKAVRKVEKGFG